MLTSGPSKVDLLFMIDDLLHYIARFYRSRVPTSEYRMVAEVLTALDQAIVPPKIDTGQPLGVVRHLDSVVAATGCTDLDMVLTEFVRIACDLPWRQTEGYLDVLSSEYLDNYGYVQLLGPKPSIVVHDSVRVGIGLWGPNLDYPLHEHAAEELYHVLHGRLAFGNQHGEWRSTEPGDSVHHEPWYRHAQRFGATPTVLLYCWTGAVTADARCVDV